MDHSPRQSALALIAVGGFVGAICRHTLALAFPTVFPWGTLTANVLGTTLLAVLLYDRRLADRLDPETRLLLGTGFCSSVTTYSTFAAETATLTPELAAVNILANYSLGFAGVLLGRGVARWST